MNHLANVIFIASTLYKPVLVEASDKALDQLNVPNELRSYEHVYKFDTLGNIKVNKAEQLFPRLDAKIEVEFISKLMKGNE